MQKNRFIPHRFTLIVLVIVMLVLTACLGGGDGEQAPVEVVPGQQYRIACNDACTARGQCGNRAGDNAAVVLVSRSNPAVDGHDISLDTNTVGDLVETRIQPVASIATNEQFDQPFHLMFFPDHQFAGWVAGWCVEPVE